MLVGMAEGAGMVLCVLWDSEEASRRVKGKPMYCQSPHAPHQEGEPSGGVPGNALVITSCLWVRVPTCLSTRFSVYLLWFLMNEVTVAKHP